MPPNRKRRRSPAEWFNSVTEYFEYAFHRLFSGIGNVFTSIGALIFPRRLVDRLRKRSSERAAQRMTDASKMGKTVEKFEDRFQVVMQGIGSTLSDLFKLFVPTKLIESTEKAVSAKTTSVYRKVSHRLSKILERITPKWLKTLLSKLNDRFEFIFKFTGAWAKSRNYVTLAWSLPAFLFLLPIMASLVGNIVYSSDDKINHYNSQLATAIEERNESAENLCFEKLSQLGFQRLDQSGYRVAVALADEGRWDEAIAAMQELAPLDSPGLPPAHLWLATQVAEGRLEVDDPWATFEQHVRHARGQSVGRFRSMRATTERLLVEADLHYGRTDEAMELMEELIGTYPELHGHMMQQEFNRRRYSDAVRHARHVFARFSEGDEEDAPDVRNAIEFVHWLLACRLLRENEELIRVLESANELRPNDEALHDVLQAQFDQRLKEISFGEPGLVPFLEKAFQLDPENQVAIRKLVNGVVQGVPAAENCVASLEASGTLPAKVLLDLGDNQIRRNDQQTAVSYYQRACKLDATQIRGWNNLAHILSHFEPVNYDLALRAINKAIELDETDSRIYETKGQILCKMGRWQEAIPNLEAGLNGSLIDPRPTHTALAEAYDKIGNPEQAAAHRAQVGN